MKLADLRKAAIKTNVRIRFALSGGMECIVSEHGIAEVPALRSVPDAGFNLEDELGRALQFTLEPVVASAKAGTRPQTLSREQLAALVSSPGAERVHDDHDE